MSTETVHRAARRDIYHWTYNGSGRGRALCGADVGDGIAAPTHLVSEDQRCQRQPCRGKFETAQSGR